MRLALNYCRDITTANALKTSCFLTSTVTSAGPIISSFISQTMCANSALLQQHPYLDLLRTTNASPTQKINRSNVAKDDNLNVVFSKLRVTFLDGPTTWAFHVPLWIVIPAPSLVSSSPHTSSSIQQFTSFNKLLIQFLFVAGWHSQIISMFMANAFSTWENDFEIALARVHFILLMYS